MVDCGIVEDVFNLLCFGVLLLEFFGFDVEVMVVVIVFFLFVLVLVVYDFVVVDLCLLVVLVYYFDMFCVFVYVGFDYGELFFVCIYGILVFGGILVFVVVEGIFGWECDVWVWSDDGEDVVVLDECDVF